MYALPIVKSQVIDDTLILDFNGILYPLSNVTRSGFQDTMIPNGGDVLYYLTSDCSGIGNYSPRIISSSPASAI